jgi:hypothetical protein
MRLFDSLVPFLASGVAIWAIATFSITEERAHEVRLSSRRGAARFNGRARRGPSADEGDCRWA